MTKHKKHHNRSKSRLRGLRNAASTRAPRATNNHRGIAPYERVEVPATTGPWGTQTLKTAGGAAGAAVTCALVARENLLPPVFITGLVTAVGATLATLGRTDTLRSIGSGAMSAAGAQLGLILLDNHYDNLATQKRVAQAQADKSAAGRAQAEKALADKSKATRSAESLPPGALEAAYERARARLAMAQAASQLAPS